MKAETFRRLSLYLKTMTKEASFGREFQQLITRLEKQFVNQLVV